MQRARPPAPRRAPRPDHIVGQLPEPFSRRPGARKTGKSPGWIDLPLPPERRLIDL
jgi:hypothetical protein